MMHMTFYWGRNVTLLFSSWKSNTWLDYSLTLVACFLFSLSYHYLEYHRRRILTSKPISSSSTTPLILSFNKAPQWNKVAKAALFGVSAAVGYMLMLAVMSFNGGVFVAVVLGLSSGYFLFGCEDDEAAAVAVALVDSPCACA